MITTYQRGDDVQLSTNFHLSEWECKCGHADCKDILVDYVHVKALQALRTALQAKITITSAFRCYKHNKDVGGGTQSQHLSGTATDIQVDGFSADAVADRCEDFAGLGRYGTFTHIDSRRDGKARWEG